MASKGKGGSSVKRTVKKRSLNAGGEGSPKQGAAFQHQDPQRRLGNFEGTGEHARVGGRTSGIVGQTTKRNHTDRKVRKKSK